MHPSHSAKERTVRVSKCREEVAIQVADKGIASRKWITTISVRSGSILQSAALRSPASHFPDRRASLKFHTILSVAVTFPLNPFVRTYDNFD